MYKVHNADILKFAQEYQGDRFHAVLCDPPYHLTSITKRFGKPGSAPAQYGTDGAYARHSGGFMGQEWDGGDVAFRPETWAAISDCLLPGAYLLAFGGTRTWHRLAVAIEDAGFEIRDTIAWVYGSGFPKSHDVSKAIDKQAGAEREVIGSNLGKPGYSLTNANNQGNTLGWSKSERNGKKECDITSPSTSLAKTWDGYGSALKPAFEPIIVARLPLDSTIAQNCATYGSGGLNIDGCRVPAPGENVPINKLENWSGFGQEVRPDYTQEINDKGRWPANLVIDDSEEVVNLFPNSKSGAMKKPYKYKNNGYSLGAPAGSTKTICDASEGSAARFFYCAKVSPSERNAGLDDYEGLEQNHNMQDKCAKCGGRIMQTSDRPSACHCEEPERVHIKAKNPHPTLKPIALTEYLARLILPPSAYAPRRILIPFSGSGSEMVGAHKAGWDEIVGVEMTEQYCKIAEARLKYWTGLPRQLELK